MIYLDKVPVEPYDLSTKVAICSLGLVEYLTGFDSLPPDLYDKIRSLRHMIFISVISLLLSNS